VIKVRVDVHGKHSGMEKSARNNVTLVSLAKGLINAAPIGSATGEDNPEKKTFTR
jgi:hypothetical protein